MNLQVQAPHGESSSCHVFDHWSIAIGDIKYLICHVTSPSHGIERSSNFKNGSSLWYVTTLPILVAIGILVVEI